MGPKPIVVVRYPLTGGGAAATDFTRWLAKEGYLVVHGNPDDLRVLASCPFTQADVDIIRSEVKMYQQHIGEECEIRASILESIAVRIEVML